MTTLDDVLTQLDAVLDTPLSLVVASPPGDQRGPAKLRLSEGAADAFRAQAQEARSRVAEGEALSFTAMAELSRAQFFLVEDEATLAELADLRTVVLGAAELDPIAPAELDGRIPLYAVGLGSGDQRVAWVKRSDPQLGHRSGRFLALARERLERVGDPVFSFGQDFDLLVAQTWAIVLNQRAFELIARETGIVERHVAGWIGGITDHLPMAEDSMRLLHETALADSRTWRRLKEIRQRGHLAHVSLDQVRAYATQVGLEPDTVVEGDRLRFDPAQRFGFLHLLNEDLYTGLLTGERFESQRKGSMD